jgi:hypothetical protein
MRQWLERHRRDREEEARRREELAEHTSQGRRRARRARQEVDSSSPEYGEYFLIPDVCLERSKADRE